MSNDPIKALERIVATGEGYPDHIGVLARSLIVIAAEALARHRSQQEAAQEPVGKAVEKRPVGWGWQNEVGDWFLLTNEFSARGVQEAGRTIHPLYTSPNPYKSDVVAWMCQHDETGRRCFVGVDQFAAGWMSENPRWSVAAPLYASPAPSESAAKDVELRRLALSWHEASERRFESQEWASRSQDRMTELRAHIAALAASGGESDAGREDKG